VGQTEGEIPGWLDVPLWWRRHRGATTAEKFEGDNQGLDSNTGALAPLRPATGQAGGSAVGVRDITPGPGKCLKT